MKTNSLFWALSWVAVGSFAVMQGCGGDDDDDGGDGSTGGTGGSAGSGTGGKGGSGGSSTGGKAGSAGSSTSGAGGAPGGAGGEGGNSVGGEGGGGTADPARVTACQLYCGSYFLNACETFATDTYDDAATCQSTCEDASWGIGVPGVVGNTINCRLSHADMAVGADRELHCGHASENPTGICVD